MPKGPKGQKRPADVIGNAVIGDIVKHHVAEVEMETTAMREYITHS